MILKTIDIEEVHFFKLIIEFLQVLWADLKDKNKIKGPVWPLDHTLSTPALQEASRDILFRASNLLKLRQHPSRVRTVKLDLALTPALMNRLLHCRLQVIPQYSILPDSSQSNVVVEPSGFLEITNYTSQQLEEDSPMEQEVDSSNDEATAASPSDQP